MSPKKVINGTPMCYVCSIPRTGSTVCHQIAVELGFHVMRSHSSGDLITKCGKQHMIVTMRDPLDIALSARKLSRKQGVNSFKFTMTAMKEFYRVRNDMCEKNEKLLMVRYEDYIHNPKQRIRDIAKFLGVSCSEERVDEIHEKTSIDRNKKIAEKFVDFNKWCKKSLIHGDHISDPYGENRDLSLLDQSTMELIHEWRRGWGYE